MVIQPAAGQLRQVSGKVSPQSGRNRPLAGPCDEKRLQNDAGKWRRARRLGLGG